MLVIVNIVEIILVPLSLAESNRGLQVVQKLKGEPGKCDFISLLCFLKKGHEKDGQVIEVLQFASVAPSSFSDQCVMRFSPLCGFVCNSDAILILRLT